MASKFLKCEDSYLISARIEDAKPMLGAMHPKAYDNLRFFEKTITLERQQEYLRRMIESETNHLYCVMNNGILIGTAGLHECDFESGNARIGELIFDPEMRGQGCGTMAMQLIIRLAFGTFSLRKIYVNILTDDLWLHAYFSWLKFKREGFLEKEYLLRGEHRDMLRFRLLKEEWKNVFETEHSLD